MKIIKNIKTYDQNNKYDNYNNKKSITKKNKNLK